MMHTFITEYTMKQAALMLGVHRDTVMYWEENLLIPPARRNPKNSYRIYNMEDIMTIAELRGISTIDTEAIFKLKEKQRKNRKSRKKELV